MRLLCLTIVAVALRAQPFPDAAAVLNRSAASFHGYGSIEFTEESTGPVDFTIEFQRAASGKIRMSTKTGGLDALLLIADGRTVWTYMLMMKRYSKEPYGGGAVAPAFAAEIAALSPSPGTDPKVVRSETLEVDGEAHDCWVIESQTDKGSITHWIDKLTAIEYKAVMHAPEATFTIARRGFKFNPALDDSLFVFTPPAEAVETDELFPGVNPATSKPAPNPAPSGETPAQAFVPSLTPVTRVEPERPASIPQDAQAEVHLLLTIDPAGSVIHAEPIVGPEVLRKPALDAILSWKFHPVIRGGTPVFAYTDAAVDFTASGKPATPPDLNDMMALSQRISALEQRFPRSPEQELADLEQDLGTDPESNREFALPRLAKAALKAGALDKAASYASGLLSLPSSDPMRGQAVHDGNMVLGLIAVRRGDLAQAKLYLVESAKTTGSPMLDSFGPNMLLAKALLEKGERDAVLEYFTRCKSFWKMGADRLDAWSATVRQGGMPSFGANLSY